MFIYVCEQDLEAMFTAIYEAWGSGHGHQNIQLLMGPIAQYGLFDTYIDVMTDKEKANKVMQSICRKLSPEVYREIAYVSMGYEQDIPDLLYHMLLLTFHYGPDALQYVQYRDVMRFRQIHARLSKEVNRFQEFTRFRELNNRLYIAHIEPKSRLLLALGPIFSDRMPSENFVIVDDVHREALIHPQNQNFFLKKLSDNEYQELQKTEKVQDMYSDLWKVFFEQIAIEQRKNPTCQRNLMPIWTRKHAVEFMD